MIDRPDEAFEAKNGKDASGDAATGRSASDARDETGRFSKGRKGGPGRPKGSRAKLGEEFFAALHADFVEHGPQVIAQVRFRHPGIYLQVLAKVMPQKIEISTPTDGMSDERLAEMLEFAERMAGLQAEHAKVIDVTPTLPAPAITIETLATPPSRSPGRDAAAAAKRADLEDQAAAVQRHEPARPSCDDIDPASLF